MDIGKVLIIMGAIVMLLGIGFLLFPKIPFLGKLPGDIVIKRDGFTFYFPLATSILLSILLSIILRLLNK